MHFLAYYISARMGCCALKFLHAIDIDQGYLAHTPTGMGVPQKMLIVHIKNWPKIKRLRVNNFRSSRSILKIFVPYDVPRARGYNVGIIFGRPAP